MIPVRFILLWFGILLATGAQATPVCGPAAHLLAGTPLSFHAADNPGGLRMVATLALPVTVKSGPAHFGLADAEAPQSLMTPRDAMVGSSEIRASQLVGGHLSVHVVGETPDFLVARGKDRAFRIDPSPNRGRVTRESNDDGGLLWLPLSFVPLMEPERNPGQRMVFRVPAGTAVVVAGPGETILPAGTVISWSPRYRDPLKVELTRAATLPQHANLPRPTRLVMDGSGRAPAGRTVNIRLDHPDIDFSGLKVDFCFRTPSAASRLFRASGRLLPEADVATYAVEIPADLRSLASTWRGPLGLPVNVEMVGIKSDGGLAVDGQMEMGISNTRLAVVFSVVLIVIVLWLSGVFIGSWHLPTILRTLLTGRSDRLSLSKLQIFLWTVLVIFSMVFVWITQGKLLELSEGILALLGISGTTSVLARAIARSDQAVVAAGGQAGASTAGHNSAGGKKQTGSLLQSDDEQFDLLRFQMLGFTVFSWFYALISVLRTDNFPEIPENLYWLLGISNTAYLGGKVRIGGKAATGGKEGPQPGAKPANQPGGFTPGVEQINAVQAKLKVPVTGVQDPATLAAVRDFENRRGTVPTDGRLTQALIDAILGG